MGQKKRTRSTAPAADSGSDSDDAPEAVSMSSARDTAAKRRRAEELGRRDVNEKNKARHRKRNDLMVEQARTRAAKAPPAPLPDEVLRQVEDSQPPAESGPDRWVLGRNPMGEDSEDSEGEEWDDEAGAGAAPPAGARPKRVVWSSDSDDDDGGSDGDGPEEGDGPVPVVLQTAPAPKQPKTVDFRKQHLYGARLQRTGGVLAASRRAAGPALRF